MPTPPGVHESVAMTELRFYHLQDQRLDRVLPQLLEISLSRGWRVVVQASSDERVEALDAQLWTYRDDSFLPHGTARNGDASEQPILIAADDVNPNGANVRFLIDGVPIPKDANSYERLVLIFDGNDDDAVALARERWTQAKAQGFEASYWQPDENGRWVQKA
jgi:DNA polymerase-3 subunit chi